MVNTLLDLFTGFALIGTALIFCLIVADFVSFWLDVCDALILLSRLPLRIAEGLPQNEDKLCLVFTGVNVVGDSVQVSIETEDDERITKLFVVLHPDDADEFAEEIKRHARLARGN